MPYPTRESGENFNAYMDRLNAWYAENPRHNNQDKPLNNLNSEKNNKFNNLNHLNLQQESKFKPSLVENLNSTETNQNLNNLKPQGVARLELYTDESLKKLMSWGVEEWLVQICIRDYGMYAVKSQINRIYQIPEGYFKPQYGPIPSQRGRLFNREMQKLKQQKAVGR